MILFTQKMVIPVWVNARETEIMNAKTSHVTRVSNTIAFYLTDNERWCIFSRYVCIENVEKEVFYLYINRRPRLPKIDLTIDYILLKNGEKRSRFSNKLSETKTCQSMHLIWCPWYLMMCKTISQIGIIQGNQSPKIMRFHFCCVCCAWWI